MDKKLLTGRKCNWEDIEIDEVFAYAGCWTIAVKTAENKAMVLACDDISNAEEGLTGTLKECEWDGTRKRFKAYNGITINSLWPVGKTPSKSRFYKLSKTIQSLFKVIK